MRESGGWESVVGDMTTEVRGWNDARKRPRAMEWSWLLKGGKNSKQFLSSELWEGTSSVDTMTKTQWSWFGTSYLQNSERINVFF